MVKEKKQYAQVESGDKLGVLVEMRVEMGTSGALALQMAAGGEVPSFELDSSFEAVPINPTSEHAASLAAANEEVVIVRGKIEKDKMEELEKQPNVVKVWIDTHIEPCVCPIPPCDCSFGNPANGTIADVANYLGVNQIWNRGFRGQGIVIGIVDGGITAIGRTPKQGETAKISRVIGGYPADWGTTTAAWGDHGNMTSTDALGMAPEAKIYDIRISDGDAISNALAGFNWAITQHKANGTPHVLSNSWCIFQENWDHDYARDPNHPFTRKVIEALDEGILVLFAAGNCGDTCPDGRCGPDKGPGRSIWGANGHPRVITVGAANLSEQFVGYSSQGPAALDPNKPDFCSITHFKGYFPNLNPAHSSDGGTSAATPIAAGVVALFKQAKPSLTQDQAKDALKRTAKDIGTTGWDQHAGAGIINAKAAFDRLMSPVTIKFRDDGIKPTLKFRDDGIKPTLKFRDDGIIPTLKFRDDIPPKRKFIDDAKSPSRDIIPREPRELPPRFAGFQRTPFILATPHHSMMWAGGYLRDYESDIAQYESMIEEYETSLAEMEEALRQETSRLEALQEEYECRLEEYKALIAEYQEIQQTK